VIQGFVSLVKNKHKKRLVGNPICHICDGIGENHPSRSGQGLPEQIRTPPVKGFKRDSKGNSNKTTDGQVGNPASGPLGLFLKEKSYSSP
jgi:hypothetical protein